MSPENFCFWLQGYLELTAAGDSTDDLTAEQVECIKDHLALVFSKATPERVGKKVKPKKPKGSPLSIAVERNPFLDLVDVTCDVPVTPNVTPPADPNQIRLDIDEAAKKREKSRKRWTTGPSPTRWVGGGWGQKYC